MEASNRGRASWSQLQMVDQRAMQGAQAHVRHTSSFG